MMHGTVAKNAVDDSERYGLDGESAVVVSAYGKGNLLRKIRVGKNTSTSTQSYVSLDENKSRLTFFVRIEQKSEFPFM